MTSTTLISEKERLYHFYVICNMSKEETCRAMGYYMKSNKNKISIHKLDEKLHLYKVFKPKCILLFNKEKGMYLKYGVKNSMYMSSTYKKIKQTNLQRYGVENTSCLNFVKEKSKQTCLKKYGVDNVAKAECIKNKIKKTNLERYGTENVFASNYGKEKIKQTCLERYDVEYYTQTGEFKEKLKQTALEKYGTEWHSQSEIVKNKIKQTNIIKYGVENVYASEYVKEKSKQTCLKKYGTEYYTQTNEYKEKVKNFNLKHYGVEYYTQTEEYREKVKAVCQEKYGVDNPSQYQPIIDKIYRIKKANKTLNISKEEEKINELLNKKFSKVNRQYKSEKYPFACDFYIPEKDLYIEYQGVVDHGHYHNKVIGPFDPKNEEHLKILNIWQEKSKAKEKSRYKTMIRVWTIRDPLKRKTAKDNGLNWLEFFTMDEFVNWYKTI